MHADRVRRKHEVQKRFYIELKGRFGLSAQPAIRVISKVADAYTTLRANIESGNYGPPGSQKRRKVAATPIGFRADAAQPFDARCLSWQIPEQVGGREATVSIWTTHGRCKNVRVLAAARELATRVTRKSPRHRPARSSSRRPAAPAPSSMPSRGVRVGAS